MSIVKTVKVCPSHTIKDVKTMLRVGFFPDIPPRSRLEYDIQMINDYQKMQDVDCSKLSLELSKKVSLNIAKGIYLL